MFARPRFDPTCTKVYILAWFFFFFAFLNASSPLNWEKPTKRMRALIPSPKRKKKTVTKTQQKSRLNIHNYPQSALSLSQSNCCIAINLRVFFLKTEPRARTLTSSLTLTIAVCVWLQRGVVSNNRQALTNGGRGVFKSLKSSRTHAQLLSITVITQLVGNPL